MPFSHCLILLETAEHLISAHKAAKLYGDATAITLIEAAMFHVGDTLSKEYSAGGGRPLSPLEGKSGGPTGGTS